jgi:hypothetical protein
MAARRILRQSRHRLITIAFLVTGSGLLAAGGAQCHALLALHAQSELARGIVIGMTAARPYRGASPVVEFRRHDGQLVRFTSAFIHAPPAYRKGDAVMVRYRTAEATRAEIAAAPAQWFGPVFVTGIGLALCIHCGAMLAGLAQARRRHRQAPATTSS